MPSTDPLDDERLDATRALEAEFSELMAKVRRVVADNAERVSPGLLPGTYKIFTTIARCSAGVTAATLAERLIVDKGQMSRAVRELEERGLISRTPDPQDGRASLLSATPEGHERLAATRPPQQGALVQKLASWSLEDIRELTRLLHALSAD